MSVLEAMACGRAVVVTDDGGLRHIVTDKGGRKVPVADSQKLAEALVEILRNEALAQSMGVHNRKQVEDQYAWDKVIDQIEALYYQALPEVSVSRTVVCGPCAN
jgi:glycosyltransferase involved in cell wall biosynthesis